MKRENYIENALKTYKFDDYIFKTDANKKITRFYEEFIMTSIEI